MKTIHSNSRPLLIGLLALVLLTVSVVEEADAEVHAACSRCKSWYVLYKNGAGFARDHVGLCGKCKATASSATKPKADDATTNEDHGGAYEGPWTGVFGPLARPLDAVESILFGEAFLAAAILTEVSLTPFIWVLDKLDPAANHKEELRDAVLDLYEASAEFFTGGHP